MWSAIERACWTYFCACLLNINLSKFLIFITGDWELLWWSGDLLNLCSDSKELHASCVCVSTVPETLVTQNTRWRCKGRKYFLTDVSIDSGPLTSWTLTPSSHITRFSGIDPFFWETHKYFCVGCRKCSLKQRFSSTDPSSSAAGCNSPRFWGLNDRHVFHILIFKQMSYSYCERCRCDILSFFNIFGMVLDRCYNMTVEVRGVGMVIDEPAAFPQLTNHSNAGNHPR